GLVKWPVPLMGQIDAEFMEVPGEGLSSAMRKHQKYFSLEDKAGRLAAHFVMVANMETEDGGAAIVAGNERVLRARLSDAKFFWDQDRKQTLSSRTPALKHIVFHAKLGTLDEKVDRIQALAVELCQYIPGSERDRVRSAARLCKADLSTEMVGEFPDLQGIMGRYYALADGEAPEVAEAIAEHYSPLGPGDVCPSAPESVAVALADKIDSLAGFFAIDEKPTGSKDPYALRRAALGVIRLILENELRIPLLRVFQAAANAADSDPSQALLDFFADRLKVHLREKGVRHDLVSAVFALGGEDDLVRLMARVDALGEFIGSEDGGQLLTAYKRATNILRIEEKKDNKSYSGEVDKARLVAPEEKALDSSIDFAVTETLFFISEEDFAGAMAANTALRAPVDAFFDQVTVNAEDAALRVNRLNLLSKIRDSLDRIADFSKIEG
ncbi:MAG: glycine--tRNA ligase subunit beta, partial [Rhodospirillaceae bacterium]|nr:glycine--tRNA ligase subunit beta [Rhodospirillaceae bacterium]